MTPRRPAGGRAVLVLNAGSSTLKASLVRPGIERPIGSLTETWSGEGGRREAATVDRVLARLGLAEGRVGSRRQLAAVGHRVVHGGETFRSPVLVDDAALAAIAGLDGLAPLHNPVAVATIRAARERLPSLAHIACFDTAFHATMPEAAMRYPVPGRWQSEWGIRRYGFHGLSVQWSVERAAALLRRRASGLRLVVAHLGAGCSVTAVDRGRSVWTSMGYTPLEGLMMATRAGSIDPGVLVRLLRERRLGLDELDDTLERRSGLHAVGGTADMRELESVARGAPGPRRDAAGLAIDMFVDRSAAAIAAATTRLPVLDAIVFTGGIGENAARVRARIVRRLAVLGVAPIEARAAARDRALGSPGARPAVLRVEAREDLVIAAAAVGLTAGRRSVGAAS